MMIIITIVIIIMVIIINVIQNSKMLLHRCFRNCLSCPKSIILPRYCRDWGRCILYLWLKLKFSLAVSKFLFRVKSYTLLTSETDTLRWWQIMSHWASVCGWRRRISAKSFHLFFSIVKTRGISLVYWQRSLLELTWGTLMWWDVFSSHYSLLGLMFGYFTKALVWLCFCKVLTGDVLLFCFFLIQILSGYEGLLLGTVFY